MGGTPFILFVDKSKKQPVLIELAAFSPQHHQMIKSAIVDLLMFSRRFGFHPFVN